MTNKALERLLEKRKTEAYRKMHSLIKDQSNGKSWASDGVVNMWHGKYLAYASLLEELYD